MSRTVYIVGNWKMHNTIAESQALVREITQRVHDSSASSTKISLSGAVRLVIAPPFTALSAVQQELGSAPIALAAQNISYASSGAHTGEISASMLADVGARYAIVGHSERRHVYGEDDQMVARRAAHALRNDITPIVCVGETLSQREGGEYLSVCERQLTVALSHFSASDIRQVLIAYEPVWAIGTGKTATPQDAQKMHNHLRAAVGTMSDAKTADAVSILYGGSVKKENSARLLSQNDIDGVLIGGASLQADSFVAIMENASPILEGAV